MSSLTQPPPLPDEDSFHLSDEEVRRLQKILNAEGGYQYSEIEAKYRGLEFLELFRMLLDPKADEERRRRPPPGPKMVPPPPSPPPVPQPFPFRLDADHAYEVESNLQMLEYELRRVKQFPSSWRWAVVAAYNALGHALAMRHPVEPMDPLHHLLELFDAIVNSLEEIRRARPTVEQLEALRTTWPQRPVREWPIERNALRQLVNQTTRLVHQLGSKR